MTRPRVLAAVLVTSERHGWPSPSVAAALVRMALDPRFETRIEFVMDHRPFHFARNTAIVMAREWQSDFCLLIDNDMSFSSSWTPLDMIAAAGNNRYVLGMPTTEWVSNPADEKMAYLNFGPILRRDGDWCEVEVYGGGALAVRSNVWREMRGPWFMTVTGDDELGTITQKETNYFCNLVRSHGWRVYIHARYCGHLKTTDVTAVGMALRQAAKR